MCLPTMDSCPVFGQAAWYSLRYVDVWTIRVWTIYDSACTQANLVFCCMWLELLRIGLSGPMNVCSNVGFSLACGLNYHSVPYVLLQKGALLCSESSLAGRMQGC